MASRRANHVDMFHSRGNALTCTGSPNGSEFFQDDVIFDPLRPDSNADLEPMFGIDTQEWVTSQSALLPASGPAFNAESAFVHDHGFLGNDPWPNGAVNQNAISMWPMTSYMAPSVSELTQLTDTLSNNSSPVTSASMCEIDGSCSPELIMPPLAMTPSVFDTMTSNPTMEDFDRWQSACTSATETNRPSSEVAKYSTSATVSPRAPAQRSSRRQSTDSDPQKARSDWRYTIPAQSDGLYHCPFVPCSHAPDKLKCNYDKHLDSHLKPYRCKIKTCGATAFSSTACVLRHEREAHGMHGHGNKPYVCMFSDCERSIPENGFPRRWNLHDHMRRMHNFIPPMDAEQSIDSRLPGQSRSKRASRTSYRQKTTSSDDTVKASKRTSRQPATGIWIDPAVGEQTHDEYGLADQVRSAAMYNPWNHMT